MDQFWCQDVPNNMKQAFRMQQNLNSIENPLFRFTANSSFPSTNLNSSLNSSANTSLNTSIQDSSLSNSFTSSNLITEKQRPYQASLQNNWKTINNLSTASNMIGPCKRKGDLDDEDDLIFFQPPLKQNANEEKVFGKFNKLSIDEDFKDSDEFILAIDDQDVIDEDFKDENTSNDDLIEFETDSVLDNDQVKFELSDDVHDFWNRSGNDVITKLVNEQRDKEAKALVIWTPRRSLSLSIPDDSLSKKTEIVDRTNEYTVYSETDDFKDSNDDKDERLEIIEIDEDYKDDEDMMETI